MKRFELRRSRREPARRAARAPTLTAVDDVSLSLDRHRTLGIVGESGSGKTTLARCLTRLIEPDEGSIVFDGVDLRALGGKELQGMRRRIQVVFQDPFSSLNPRLTVGAAIAEPLRVHGIADARRGAAPGSPSCSTSSACAPPVARRFPRELSGGQRQRVAIARSLAPQPELLIADEAVSALDVSIQAQILNLLVDLTERLGLTMIFISHQLSVIANVADDVAVMYLGRIVEHGPVERGLRAPAAPVHGGAARREPRAGPGAPAARRPRSAATSPRRSTSRRAAASGRAARYAEERCAEVDPPAARRSARATSPAASLPRPFRRASGG